MQRDGAYVVTGTLVHAGPIRSEFNVAGGSVGRGLFLGLGNHCVGVLQQRLLDGVDVLGHDRHHVLHRLGHDRGHLPQQLFAGRRGINATRLSMSPL